MRKRLYVSNFPFATTEEQLRTLFNDVAAVEKVRVVRDQETRKPRGFGFVEMVTEAGAQMAIAQLDQSNLGGRMLNVAFANDPTDGRRRRRGGRGRRDRDTRVARW